MNAPTSVRDIVNDLTSRAAECLSTAQRLSEIYGLTQPATLVEVRPVGAVSPITRVPISAPPAPSVVEPAPTPALPQAPEAGPEKPARKVRQARTTKQGHRVTPPASIAATTGTAPDATNRRWRILIELGRAGDAGLSFSALSQKSEVVKALNEEGWENPGQRVDAMRNAIQKLQQDKLVARETGMWCITAAGRTVLDAGREAYK